ncbi:MAG: phenylacetate--CoA ligase family protein [Caldilineae bacterium]|nr:MAG: phenylacetate--CoA ligase family protein [Caldilineae bacterium]
MAELNRHQWLSAEEIEAVQRRQLQTLLEYADRYVPYYQALFARIGFRPADFAADPAAFRRIPPLTKADIRRHYDRLITTEPARRKHLFQAKTGGTTGEPLWFKQDRTYRCYNTAYVYHNMQWAGWQLGDPQFWLWGHVPEAGHRRQPSAGDWLANFIANRFDVDAFVIAPDDMERLARHMERKPGGILWSYVSTAHRFAQFLAERGHTIHLRGVYVAAEPLFPPQREQIESALGCPVFNNYSSIDTGAIARECDRHDGLHIATRNVYVEVLRNGEPVPDGEEGEFVITGLINYGMPLIRYKIEDWGAKSNRPCSCGRGEPLLKVVEGRQIDLFKTRDGRVVYGAFAKDLLPALGDVKQFQVIQKSLERVVFRIVKEGEINRQQLRFIERVTKDSLGEEVEVQFEFVDSLPDTPTGKHRYLVSEVP